MGFALEGAKMLSLSAEPDLFIAAFQSLPFALMMTDVDGIIRWANPRLLNLTGYADGEMVGESAARLGFGTSEHAFEDLALRAISTGEPSQRHMSFDISTSVFSRRTVTSSTKRGFRCD